MPYVELTTSYPSGAEATTSPSVYFTSTGTSLNIAWISGPTGPSGRQGVVTGIYPIYYNSGQQAVGIYSGYFALSGDLYSSGQYLYGVITGASGLLMSSINDSGQYLETKIDSLSGFLSSAYYTASVSDAKFVHLTGNETVAGEKTFSSVLYYRHLSGANADSAIHGRQIYNQAYKNIVFDLDDGEIYDGRDGKIVIYPRYQLLMDWYEQIVLDWGQKRIYDSNGNDSIFWDTRLLKRQNESVSLDWQNNILSGNWIVQGLSANISGTGSFASTGWVDQYYYPRTNPSGYLTGVETGHNHNAQYYPLETNPSGYLTGFDSGLYALKSDTGNFVIYAQFTGTSGALQSQITIINNVTGDFYPRYNPSGYITGVDTGHAHDSQYYPLTDNPSGYVTGNVIRPSDTGIFATYSQLTGVSGNLQVQIDNIASWSGDSTGLYYPLIENPAGYISTGDADARYLNILETVSGTGSFATTGWVDDGYYPRNNPSGYITGVETGHDHDSQYYPLGSNPSGYISGFNSGDYVQKTETGIFVQRINLTGLVTEIVSGSDQYFIEFGFNFSATPIVNFSIEWTGMTFYSANMWGRTVSGYNLDFSDVVAESGIAINTIAYLP